MLDPSLLEKIIQGINSRKKIMFLVGAGISAASGIPTFRGEEGYWVSGSKRYRPQEIGTRRFFEVASHEVLKFYLERKAISEKALPNPNHFLLKELELLLKDQYALVSQNVDGLHKKAGSNPDTTFLIHGDHDFMRCSAACSNDLYPFPEGINLATRDTSYLTFDEISMLQCPKCGEELRPHVLWFDEYYNEKFYKKDSVLRISKQTAVLFILGTSGETALPQQIAKNVLAKNGLVIEVNIAESYFSKRLHHKKNGWVIHEDAEVFLKSLLEALK